MDIANSSVNKGPKWSIDSMFVGGFLETGEFTFIYVPCIIVKFKLSIFCSDANPFLAGLNSSSVFTLRDTRNCTYTVTNEGNTWPSCRVKQFH